MLRDPRTLDIFAPLYGEKLTAEELIDWAAWETYTRLTENTREAHAKVLEFAGSSPSRQVGFLADPRPIV